MNIGCTILTRNCISQDYCLFEALQSVVPVVDQIVVCDADSSDGTREKLIDFGKSLDGVRFDLVAIPFSPVICGLEGHQNWLARGLNAVRSLLTTQLNFHIEADEVLHENSYDRILEHSKSMFRPLKVRLIEFWNDSTSYFDSNLAARFAPSQYQFVSDGGGVDFTRGFDQDGSIEIYHYGFIRDPETWVNKMKFLQTSIHGCYDARIDAGRDAILNSRDMTKLKSFNGTHPKHAKQWLAERGHKV